MECGSDEIEFAGEYADDLTPRQFAVMEQLILIPEWEKAMENADLLERIIFAHMDDEMDSDLDQTVWSGFVDDLNTMSLDEAVLARQAALALIGEFTLLWTDQEKLVGHLLLAHAEHASGIAPLDLEVLQTIHRRKHSESLEQEA